MTDDLQEIDGIGPSREETLNEAGYETYTALAEVDGDTLAEDVNRLSEDKALDIVVQAQNLEDLEEAVVEEAGSEPKEIDDEAVEEELEELEAEIEEETGPEDETETEGETTFEVEITFDSSHEYDTFYHTLLEERCNLRRTNRAGVESYEKMLESMRATSAEGSFSVELTEDELNDLHNAVMEQRVSYQGENLIDYMDALRVVENNVNAVREEFLF
jgi:predicted RecB family nuclease